MWPALLYPIGFFLLLPMAGPATTSCLLEAQTLSMINTNDSSHTESVVPCWVSSNHCLMTFTTALQVAITTPTLQRRKLRLAGLEWFPQAHTGSRGFLKCQMEWPQCRSESLRASVPCFLMHLQSPLEYTCAQHLITGWMDRWTDGRMGR